PAAAPAKPIESDSATPAAPATPAEPAKPADEEEGKEEEAEEAEEVAEDTSKPEEEETEEEKPSETETQPPPPPAYSAPAYPPTQQKESGVLGVPTGLKYPFFLHNNFLLLFIFIGMIFTLIGGILSGSAIITENSDIYGASVITISLGLFTFSTFLVLAAVFRDDMNHFVRLGLLITGGIAVFGLILYSRFGI
ncbi:MAG: hypothetical protein KAJ51_14315, partial [Thermoplasmata archaeon]|nr:hypothetical protein [Thermoplasmata archaeon]